MKIYPYILASLIFISSFVYAQPSYNPAFEMNANINTKNTILAKVADKAITAYDVKKRLDIFFNRSFPDLIESTTARYQYYISGWQHTLDDMINNQLMLIDAEKKELKITDGELREEIETRYGPNVMINLEKINLTYEEALKATKEEMILQRMMYYFIKAKADQKITPSAIRNAYRLYCNENPPQQIWSYHVISIRSDDDKLSSEIAQKTLALLKEKNTNPKELEELIKELEKDSKNCKINLSKLYSVNNKEISSSQQKILSSLEKNSYSDIVCQTSRSTKKKINRIFYLKDYEKKETESFVEMSSKLKDQLLNTTLLEESDKYFAKLKNQYHVEKNPNISKDFVPFVIE